MGGSCEQGRAGCEQEKHRIRPVDLVQCQRSWRGWRGRRGTTGVGVQVDVGRTGRAP